MIFWRALNLAFVQTLARSTARGLLAIALLPATFTAHALTVLHPATGEVVTAGDDYATQVLGNAWDMNDSIDIDMEESFNVTNQSLGGGHFFGTTTAADANIYPLFEGQLSSINLSRGATFPVDTSHYRYLTVKMKATKPSVPVEFSRVVFYQVNGTYGLGAYHLLAADNSYVIFTNDMLTQIDGTSPHQWTDFAQVTGLRIDPATPGGAFTTGSQFNIDWIRLTAPATASQKTPVQWTDSGYSGSYNITAVDADNVTTYPLGATSGTSYLADTSFLAPGAYRIKVARTGGGGATALSQIFYINSPPQPELTSPSVRGDQTRDFATIVAGNPWGPIDATDFSINGATPNGVINFKLIPPSSSYYTTPVGSFHGRPTNDDPQWFLNLHNQAIDTSIYRSLCFKQEVFGPRVLGEGPTAGSVARVFWGPTAGSLTTSDDIVLHDNVGDSIVSEYCIPDLAAANVIDPTATPAGGTWSGMKSAFRIDPSEFTPPGGCSTPDTCHDVRLDSVTLSPFAHANPNYTFTWTLADPDNASDTIDLYLDPDTNPDNGNEILIHSQTAGSGNGQYVYTGSGLVASGTYHALIVADDGYNAVAQYAGGPIIVTSSDVIFRNGFEATP